MLGVTAVNHNLLFGKEHGFALNFQRTLRIPDDDKTYPLPPGLGQFPIMRVADYLDRVPESWRARGGFFIPMYQREALWISFSGRHWRPNAVKIGIGRINAISGERWQDELLPYEEDYIVCPPQLWLDGINAGDGFIRQFVAMPLGMGYTVEAQLTGAEEFGGIQIMVYEPKPGKFPEEPPPYVIQGGMNLLAQAFGAAPPSPMVARGVEMGLGAGGRMKQKIYPDRHGFDTWDADNLGRVDIHIVNSMMFREVTGQEPPPTPITAKLYAQYGYPWFDLYDEQMDDIHAPYKLQQIKSVKEMDAQKGFAPQQDDDSVEIPDGQVVSYEVDADKGIKP
ncbi:MAG: hypothetical protein IAE79_07005 [Anaerolinea sp.]|nr:hypothetical protein [Anaerolinea sp.]